VDVKHARDILGRLAAHFEEKGTHEGIRSAIEVVESALANQEAFAAALLNWAHGQKGIPTTRREGVREATVGLDEDGAMVIYLPF
jgi:hypothetical protein